MINSQSEPRDKCVCFVLGQSSALEIGGWNVGLGGLEDVDMSRRG